MRQLVELRFARHRHRVWRFSFWTAGMAFVLQSTGAPLLSAGIWEDRQAATAAHQTQIQQVEQALVPRDFQDNRAAAKSSVLAERYQQESQQLLGTKIPATLGTVVETYIPKANHENLDDNFKNPIIVHIQDAHGVYEAQKNASEILRIVASLKNADTVKAGEPDLKVFVEGAWGSIFPNWVSLFPEEGYKDQAAAELLREGRITGEEYADIVQGPGKIGIEGIEEPDAYNADMLSRINVDSKRAEVIKKIDSLSMKMRQLKLLLYEKNHLTFDRMRTEYEDNQIDLQDYLSFLKMTHPHQWDGTRYPNLIRMMNLVAMENKFPPAAIERESKELIDILSEKLDKNTLSQVVQMGLNYRLGHIDGARYFKTLNSLADVYGMKTQYIRAYAQYQELTKELDHTLLSNEIQDLEQVIVDSYAARNPNLKQLIHVAELLRVHEKFWSEKFAPRDWSEFKVLSKKTDVDFKNLTLAQIEAYLDMESSRLKVMEAEPSVQASAPGTSAWNESELHFYQQSYYEIAFKRDTAMVNRALELAQGLKRAVLIAGGFHTPGITRVLKEKEVPYVVIRPSLQIPEGVQIQPDAPQPDAQSTPKEQSRLPKGTLDQTELDNRFKSMVAKIRTKLALAQQQSQRYPEYASRLKEVADDTDRFSASSFEYQENRAVVRMDYQGENARVPLEAVLVRGKTTDSKVSRIEHDRAQRELERTIKASLNRLRNHPGTFTHEQRVSLIFSLLALRMTQSMTGETWQIERVGVAKEQKAEEKVETVSTMPLSRTARALDLAPDQTGLEAFEFNITESMRNLADTMGSITRNQAAGVLSALPAFVRNADAWNKLRPQEQADALAKVGNAGLELKVSQSQVLPQVNSKEDLAAWAHAFLRNLTRSSAKVERNSSGKVVVTLDAMIAASFSELGENSKLADLWQKSSKDVLAFAESVRHSQELEQEKGALAATMQVLRAAEQMRSPQLTQSLVGGALSVLADSVAGKSQAAPVVDRALVAKESELKAPSTKAEKESLDIILYGIPKVLVDMYVRLYGENENVRFIIGNIQDFKSASVIAKAELISVDTPQGVQQWLRNGSQVILVADRSVQFGTMLQDKLVVAQFLLGAEFKLVGPAAKLWYESLPEAIRNNKENVTYSERNGLAELTIGAAAFKNDQVDQANAVAVAAKLMAQQQ